MKIQALFHCHSELMWKIEIKKKEITVSNLSLSDSIRNYLSDNKSEIMKLSCCVQELKFLSRNEKKRAFEARSWFPWTRISVVVFVKCRQPKIRHSQRMYNIIDFVAAYKNTITSTLLFFSFVNSAFINNTNSKTVMEFNRRIPAFMTVQCATYILFSRFFCARLSTDIVYSSHVAHTLTWCTSSFRLICCIFHIWRVEEAKKVG